MGVMYDGVVFDFLKVSGKSLKNKRNTKDTSIDPGGTPLYIKKSFDRLLLMTTTLASIK